MNNPYDDAREFADLFSRCEHALKRAGFLRANRPDAQADWNSFARRLGPEFFERIKASGSAATLIGEPPRKLLKEGLEWAPANPKPLESVIELFEQGVCRVRNNYIHGEKFVSESGQFDRDATLVREALAVLRQAEASVGSEGDD
jgi:hypothetical protein